MKIAIEAQRIFHLGESGRRQVSAGVGQYAYRTDRLPILPFVGANRTAVNPEKDTA